MMYKLKEILEDEYKKIDGIYTDSSSGGYWSNLKKEDQSELLHALKNKSCLDVINDKFPQLNDSIFDQTRAVGLDY